MKSNRNIFLIVMDTAQKNRLSAYGHNRSTTPFLNSFQSEAVKYTNAVSQAPWTLPSHASMFTGKYPNEHKAIQESPYMSKQETIASILTDGNYKTGLFSANAWISPHTGLTYGFDKNKNLLGNLPSFIEKITSKFWETANKNKYLQNLVKTTARTVSWMHKKVIGQRYESYTPKIMKSAEKFVKNNSENKFVCLNLLDPHLPYTPPMDYIKEIGGLDERPSVCLDSKLYNAGVREINDEEWKKIKILYDAELRYLDDKIKSFIQFLKDEDEYENSLIIICSDHGELHGKHGIYGHEFGLYEELINVPLMIRHPNKESKVIDKTVELMDIFHTILEFSGTDSDKFCSERSIFNDNYRSTESKNLQYPEYAFSEYSKPMVALHEIQKIAEKRGEQIPENSKYMSSMTSVRNHKGKYIHRSDTQDQLFSFQNGKDEEVNCLEDEPDLVENYVNILQEHSRTGKADVEKVGVDGINDDIKGRLGDLGYLE